MHPAEQLLTDLGITEPADIDVRAIADCVGVEVHFRSLSGCEAQIIGFRDRAIIYVDQEGKPTRKRFSAGHELGHWYHHRGQSFVCRREDIGRPADDKSKDAERLADLYAADLILPPFMLRPILQSVTEVSLNAVLDIANRFSASITATALRIVRMTDQPIILVAHNLFGKKWQWPSASVGRLRIRDDLDPRASAFSATVANERVQPIKKEPAHYWFDRRHVEQFDVRSQSIRTLDGELLTLVHIPDRRLVDIYG